MKKTVEKAAKSSASSAKHVPTKLESSSIDREIERMFQPVSTTAKKMSKKIKIEPELESVIFSKKNSFIPQACSDELLIDRKAVDSVIKVTDKHEINRTIPPKNYNTEVCGVKESSYQCEDYQLFNLDWLQPQLKTPQKEIDAYYMHSDCYSNKGVASPMTLNSRSEDLSTSNTLCAKTKHCSTTRSTRHVDNEKAVDDIVLTYMRTCYDAACNIYLNCR